MVKFRVPNFNSSWDMNYFLPFLSSPERQTIDRQKVMHMSPSCNLHRWAQKTNNMIKCIWSLSHYLQLLNSEYTKRKTTHLFGKYKLTVYSNFKEPSGWWGPLACLKGKKFFSPQIKKYHNVVYWCPQSTSLSENERTWITLQQSVSQSVRHTSLAW